MVNKTGHVVVKVGVAHTPVSTETLGILTLQGANEPRTGGIGLVSEVDGTVLINVDGLHGEPPGAGHAPQVVLSAADGVIRAGSKDMVGVDVRNSVGSLDVVKPSGPSSVVRVRGLGDGGTYDRNTRKLVPM